jgi:hypothetical protein
MCFDKRTDGDHLAIFRRIEPNGECQERWRSSKCILIDCAADCVRPWAKSHLLSKRPVRQTCMHCCMTRTLGLYLSRLPLNRPSASFLHAKRGVGSHEVPRRECRLSLCSAVSAETAERDPDPLVVLPSGGYPIGDDGHYFLGREYARQAPSRPLEEFPEELSHSSHRVVPATAKNAT